MPCFFEALPPHFEQPARRVLKAAPQRLAHRKRVCVYVSERSRSPRSAICKGGAPPANESGSGNVLHTGQRCALWSPMLQPVRRQSQ